MRNSVGYWAIRPRFPCYSRHLLNSKCLLMQSISSLSSTDIICHNVALIFCFGVKWFRPPCNLYGVATGLLKVVRNALVSRECKRACPMEDVIWHPLFFAPYLCRLHMSCCRWKLFVRLGMRRIEVGFQALYVDWGNVISWWKLSWNQQFPTGQCN